MVKVLKWNTISPRSKQNRKTNYKSHLFPLLQKLGDLFLVQILILHLNAEREALLHQVSADFLYFILLQALFRTSEANASLKWKIKTMMRAVSEIRRTNRLNDETPILKDLPRGAHITVSNIIIVNKWNLKGHADQRFVLLFHLSDVVDVLDGQLARDLICNTSIIISHSTKYYITRQFWQTILEIITVTWWTEIGI